MRKTEKQWNKLGYFVNDGERGELYSCGDCYGTKHEYFEESQVHKDEELAKKQKRLAKERKLFKELCWEKMIELAESDKYYMQTTWQWIDDGRIPKSDAEWRVGGAVLCDYADEVYQSREWEFSQYKLSRDVDTVLRLGGSEKYYYCSKADTVEADIETLRKLEQSYVSDGSYDGTPWW